MIIDNIDEKLLRNILKYIDSNRENLMFSIEMATSLWGDIYIELYKENGCGILFSFFEGVGYDKSSCFYNLINVHRINCINSGIGKNFDDMYDSFDYSPYIFKTELSADDYNNILSIMESNPLPSVEYKQGGHDGFDVTFHNYVLCDSVYRYWCYPPSGYEFISAINKILSVYISDDYRRFFLY